MTRRIDAGDMFARADLMRKRMHVKRQRLGRVPRWLYPRAIEIQYRVWLVRLVKRLRAATEEILLARLPFILSDADRLRHTDSWPEDLAALMGLLEARFGDLTGEAATKAFLLNIGQKSSAWNDREWQKTLKQVMGVNVFGKDSWLVPHLQSFVNENTALITKLQSETLQEIRQVTESGIRMGARHETIRQEILDGGKLGRGRFKKAETRAKLIARDQVGKLNGELTQVRQQSLDIKKYKWRTSLDERVRDEDRIKEGKTFEWANPPPGGHPGRKPQCRCQAEPIFDFEDLPEMPVPVTPGSVSPIVLYREEATPTAVLQRGRR